VTTTSAPPPALSPGAPQATRTEPRRRRRTVPADLRLLLIVLVAAAVAYGAVGTWTVIQHGSAAQNVVSTSEPLSLGAQRMYQALSDADVTATTSFLIGPNVRLPARERYAADIDRAAAELTRLENATTTSANPRLVHSLAAAAAGLPVYTGYVSQAQTQFLLGYRLTAGSLMQVASEEMRLTLLPAARASYAQENAALTAASAQATGLPWIVAMLILAIVLAFVLYRAQRWLSRSTHRVLNIGMLAATVALVVSAVWLIGSFAVARTDLQRAAGHGSEPAEALAQAAIDTQQARGYQMLNFISRSGDATFVKDFQTVRAKLGPGPGTLLAAAASSSSGAGAHWAAAAGRDLQSWYTAIGQAYALDSKAQYTTETALVIGTGANASTAGFARVEADLSKAINADDAVFHSNATAGRNAFTGLDLVIVIAAALMAAGCAWGLSRRLAEYR
jgi:ABC-type multidrug transport system fused ATPase/permease subunit